MILQGKILKLGNNINTDDIIAGQYLRTNDFSLWQSHVFETLDSQIASIILERQFIFAGENFGCGSSREQAVIALKCCGIKAVIAKSFGRIFFRNCINNGIIAATFSQNYWDKFSDGSEIIVNTEESILINANQEKFMLDQINPVATKIYEATGLLEYYKIYGGLVLHDE
ncbi:MAG TPA: 3-isopropylmalate dehydratase [Patescibacteria group bacterium]|nr:3-isopropylmalate dehydratase [Gammaproteobacteria bacterium]HWA51487.1 3-isopropylmalate dehydratase [Patescibacteria group bacterium]